MTMTPREMLENPYYLHFEKKIEDENQRYRRTGMSLPVLDVDMLREQITWAKKSAETQEEFQLAWNQGSWLMSPSLTGDQLDYTNAYMGGAPTKQKFVPENFCGTTGCIAGSIALRFGEPIWAEDELQAGSTKEKVYQADEVMVEGELWNISEFAQIKLGLTDIEAAFMFYGGSDLDRIEYIARRACERRGLTY